MSAARFGVSLGLAMLACTGRTPPPSASPSPTEPGAVPKAPATPELSIEIYEQRVGVIYEYERLLQHLRDGAGGKVHEKLDERDVDRYVVGPWPSGLVAMHLTPAASNRWRSAVAPYAETQPFVVSLRGEHLYSGVIYAPMGAAAIQSPVVHVSDHQGRIVLTFGGMQGMAYIVSSPEASKRIDRRELRALFEKRGALDEESSPPRPLGQER